MPNSVRRTILKRPLDVHSAAILVAIQPLIYNQNNSRNLCIFFATNSPTCATSGQPLATWSFSAAAGCAWIHTPSNRHLHNCLHDAWPQTSLKTMISSDNEYHTMNKCNSIIWKIWIIQMHAWENIEYKNNLWENTTYETTKGASVLNASRAGSRPHESCPQSSLPQTRRDKWDHNMRYCVPLKS